MPDSDSQIDSIRKIVRMALRTYRDKKNVLATFEGFPFDIETVSRVIDEEYAELEKVHVVGPTRVVDVPDGHLWYGGPEALDRPSYRWQHFRGKLTENGRSQEQIHNIDRDSTAILARTPSPIVEGGASGRGLVLGYVQSGKTTNFMALAAKAADAGYRFIVVLSGVTNSLRNQTQSELEKYVSPYNNHLDWFWLTNLDRDFLSSHAPAVTGVFNNPNNVAICVVKKNGSKLNALLDWYQKLSEAQRDEIPLLVIDDECDQASINGLAVKRPIAGVQSSTDAVEVRRTAINRLIVKLIGKEVSSRAAYVGYSATPFSNLLLDPNDEKDLYPRDFIYSLEKGAGYFGPEEIFGRDPIDEADQATNALDIFNNVDPLNVPLLGSAHSATANESPQMIPELSAAICWLLLSSAIRDSRNSNAVWTTMLIHTSQRISCHEAMADLVSDYLDSLKKLSPEKLQNVLGDVLKIELPKLLVSAFAEELPDAGQIISGAIDQLSRVEIVVDNSKSDDRLNYEVSAEQLPHPVIVIGGNTLSRGLVLHGLISTFFLRTARGYDALLQMGRWFGYRDGWADLPRIWMTVEMQTSFRFLALVEEEVRQQIAMYSADRNPLEIGVRIRCHPKLQVTARGLGRVQRHIGLSGLRVETILFPRSDVEFLSGNLEVGRSFVTSLGDDAPMNPDLARGLFRNVPVAKILELLDNYRFANDARVAERNVLKKYIEKIVDLSSADESLELHEWDVFLYRLKGANPRLVDLVPGVPISKITRSARQTKEDNSVADLHHLASQIDVATSIDEEVLASYLSRVGRAKSDIKYEEWPILKRDHFGESGRGLLGLYLVDKDSKSTTNNKRDLEAAEDFLGLTFFFPLSKFSKGEIDYVAPPEFIGNIDPEDLEPEVFEDPSEIIGEIDSDDDAPETDVDEGEEM